MEVWASTLIYLFAMENTIESASNKRLDYLRKEPAQTDRYQIELPIKRATKIKQEAAKETVKEEIIFEEVALPEEDDLTFMKKIHRLTPFNWQ